ncbi:hypothetical protein IWW36_004761 [Coemansia brasiliensis]|uniref:Uncharacterized protein n=1 Tax=Coemansia brasiliensis TaxID=2650707 RepID=A0A9W8I2R1_9FUNG|nr:hypothetical protein IWW36_004761 [Coemansia brasiliensis]
MWKSTRILSVAFRPRFLAPRSIRNLRTTTIAYKDAFDKERQRQQAQDDLNEEVNEYKRHDTEQSNDLAPETERLDPQSIPGLYPSFEKEDDSWYIDPEYSQPSEFVPLWQRRSKQPISEASLDAPMFDMCCALLREDGPVSVYDVRDRCEWTSQMVVAEATSTRHMRAMGERLLKSIKEKDRRNNSSRTIRVDGRESDDWMVIDMGVFVVHIMTPEAYKTYDLKSLWTTPLYEPDDIEHKD